ncbi:protein ADP-ribosyltransferase PARP3 [Hevea brasiliensis]|uniref:protein ADP-ribosyltransferase PARP3 n=1 Tax=Hevea brasiliensis TaxID=3981 RepID=UPI0025E3C41E|nr:protein ADP-ribosyltransferase PARP3 [Hevea brasiliensis]
MHSARPLILSDYDELADNDYGVSVENIFAVEPSACPSVDEIKKLPKSCCMWYPKLKLVKAFEKRILASYLFTSCVRLYETARYDFTAVDRVERFLVLAVVSQGDHNIELSSPPERIQNHEEKKLE